MSMSKRDSTVRRRSGKGRALFYTRDSGGKHEMTPGQYVLWAAQKAKECGLEFSGSPAQIEQMIRYNIPAQENVYQDYNVAGNVLSRPGLNALLREIENDFNVSHVFIPRPDRLARPNEIMEGVELETRFRQKLGVTLVFMERTGPPIPRGKKLQFVELIVSASDYEQAERFRGELAMKTLNSQLALARRGYSAGGRASYGLSRWLISDDGTLIRELQDGEIVRTKGQHVVWQKGPPEKWETRRRIVNMLLDGIPASRVARMLTEEGVPAPDAGRRRKDGGQLHIISGVWHPTSVTNIARDPRNIAIHEYGRRSMGDRYRYGPQGPRGLEERDFQINDQPKVVENPESMRTRAPAKIEPLLSLDEHEQLIKILDERSGTQRGKPRSRNPDRNPLGGRVFDIDCTWPMYRQPYQDSFRYTCGLYLQSYGARCRHNHLNGPLCVEFGLSCIRQRLLSPSFLSRLEQRIRGLADQERQRQSLPVPEVASKQSQLTEIHDKLTVVRGNLAYAKDRDQYDAVSGVFEELEIRRKTLEAEVANQKRSEDCQFDATAEAGAAMALVTRLANLANNAQDFAAAGEVFKNVNLRIFLQFRDERAGKRICRRVAGGVVTFGNAEPPIAIYRGPTAREAVNELTAPKARREAMLPLSKSEFSDSEGNSLRNVNRGDKI
jgi:DNA invertase Pin-like site-specific DNA recombinase